MSTAKNTFIDTETTSLKLRNTQKKAIFLFTTIGLLGLLSLVFLVGCGDYYVNVDKEAVKLEIDSLIDKEALDGLRKGN